MWSAFVRHVRCLNICPDVGCDVVAPDVVNVTGSRVRSRAPIQESRVDAKKPIALTDKEPQRGLSRLPGSFHTHMIRNTGGTCQEGVWRIVDLVRSVLF